MQVNNDRDQLTPEFSDLFNFNLWFILQVRGQSLTDNEVHDYV